MGADDKETIEQARVRRLINMRLDHVFRSAWVSIAKERGWYHDNFLGTSSHGTLCVRSYFSALGV